MNKENEEVDRIDHALLVLSKLIITMRRVSFIFAGYGILQGMLILIGGDDRFSQIGYIFALSVPGAPSTWGWVILTFGIMSFIGVKNRMYTWSMVGMTGSGLWSLSFGTAFLLSAANYPNANLTAIATYGKDAVLFFLMASVMAKLRKQSRLEASNA